MLRFHHFDMLAHNLLLRLVDGGIGRRMGFRGLQQAVAFISVDGDCVRGAVRWGGG